MLATSSPPDRSGDDDAASRRAYQRPKIVFRQRIEAMAADCSIPGGKNDSSCILAFS